MDFVTVADLACRPIEAVLGFEQHADLADPSFGVAVLRVRCNPALDGPAYFPPCTADPDLALVLLPDGWLTHGALVEAARVYLRRSGEWGPVLGRGEEVIVRYWMPRADRQSDGGLPVFLHPDGEMVCQPPVLACAMIARDGGSC
jgi:hypothetical protein